MPETENLEGLRSVLRRAQVLLNEQATEISVLRERLSQTVEVLEHGINLVNQDGDLFADNVLLWIEKAEGEIAWACGYQKRVKDASQRYDDVGKFGANRGCL